MSQLTASSLLAAASVTLAAPAFGQQLLYSPSGPGVGGNSGSSVAIVGDMNLDGFPEVLSGAPAFDLYQINQGRAFLYSGANGAFLTFVSGTEAGDAFGTSVVALADSDLDGNPEAAVGAPLADTLGNTDSGRIRLYESSTSNGAVSLVNFRVFEGNTSGGQRGASLSAVSAGGIFGLPARILIGAPGEDPAGLANAGSAYLYNTSSGTLVHRYDGTQAGERFGSAVSGSNDVNNDGNIDVVIGSPDYDSALIGVGRVQVFSTASPFALVTSRTGAIAGAELGSSVLSLPDLTGDGRDEFAGGAPLYDSTSFTNAGAAYLFNGAGGTLFTFTGVQSQAHLGHALARAGDLNGDGKTDLLVGAPGSTLVPPVSGVVYTFSGANGSTLAAQTGPEPTSYGRAVAGGSDISGDGKPDYVAGSPDAVPTGTAAGSISVMSAAAGTPPVVWTAAGSLMGARLGSAVASIGDINGDGIADFAAGASRGLGTQLLFGILLEYAGTVRAYSGADGSVLWTTAGSVEGDELGFALAAAGDLTGDGKVDLIAGAPQRLTASPSPGYVRFINGATGATIATVSGVGSDEQYGSSVAALGGAFHIGTTAPAFVVGVPGYDLGKGRIDLVTTAGAFPPFPFQYGLAQLEKFGASVSGIGDVNGDGKQDVLVGAPDYSQPGFSQNGRAVVLVSLPNSMTVGAQVFGTSSTHHLGTSVVGLPDVNGDGKNDFAAGSICELFSIAPARVAAFSSVTGAKLWEYQGLPGQGTGRALAVVGDTDLDGVADLVATGVHPGSQALPGHFALLSGKTGQKMLEVIATNLTDAFGSSVAGAGDLNGDGTPDLLVGAPRADGAGDESGSVLVYSLRPIGVEPYGASTPGCAGAQRLVANSVPDIGNVNFRYGANRAPASSLGLLLASDSKSPSGSDPFGIGIALYVDLFAATEVFALDMVSDAAGFAQFASPLAANPALVGKKYFLQVLWAWNSCALPPYGLSASHGLEITIQP